MIPPARSWRQDATDVFKKKGEELRAKYGKAEKIPYTLIGTPNGGIIMAKGKELDWSKKRQSYSVFRFLSGRCTATIDEISKEALASPLSGKSERYILSMRANVSKMLSRMRAELTSIFGGEWLVCVNARIGEYALEPTRLLPEAPQPEAPQAEEAPDEPEAEAKEEASDLPEGVSPKNWKVFMAVLTELEKAAERGEKQSISVTLAGLGYKASDWSYALEVFKQKGLTDYLERYNEAAAKTRSRGPRPRDVTPRAPLPEPKPLNLERFVPKAEPEPEPVPSAPVMRADIVVDSETGALTQIIMLLKPYTKEDRDRILATASVFLGVD